MSATVTMLFEILSVQYGLRDYILSHPRTDLLSANREGIFGCVGYTTVFYSGAAIGAFVLGQKRSGSGWMFFALQFAAVTLLLWAAVALLEAAGMRQSRRLVNISYIVWTIAYNMLILCLFLCAELALHFVETKRGTTIARLRRDEKPAMSGDALSDSFNRNLLALFLAGNLLTGAVNLSMPTIDAAPPVAFAVVFTYAAALLALALLLNSAGITLKFW
jgi:glucosaminylphosphatidylinositol acyltransferase